MSTRDLLKTITPEPIRKLLRPIRNAFVSKYGSELSFWKSRLAVDKGTFVNTHYARLMLGMAERSDSEFVRGKIIADFGCGPRGSLVWAESALLRIGIDVLADRYADEFADNIVSHGMLYLKSTENVIPLPSNLVDVLFTLNAMDHVDNLEKMCNELLRILKPGGELIASFNLEEPASPSEPQRLTEKVLAESLLDKLQVLSYRATRPGIGQDRYAPFFAGGNLAYEAGEEGILWVRAKKAS